jgi:hypothetical protein
MFSSFHFPSPFFSGIIIQRDTFANFFHDSEDFFNLFLTLAILNLSLDDVVLLILDLYPKGNPQTLNPKP